MPLDAEAIAKYRKNAHDATPQNIEAVREQAARARTIFEPGDRVFCRRMNDSGHGTVICTHSCSSYVCVTVRLDSDPLGDPARIEASRVTRSNEPAPALMASPQGKARKARKSNAA